MFISKEDFIKIEKSNRNFSAYTVIWCCVFISLLGLNTQHTATELITEVLIVQMIFVFIIILAISFILLSPDFGKHYDKRIKEYNNQNKSN